MTDILDPIVGFGRYKGSRVSQLPADYVLWIARPERRSEKTRDFKAPDDVVAACLRRADDIEAEARAEAAIRAVLAGVPDETRGTVHVIEYLGDLEREDATMHPSLPAALDRLAERFPMGETEDLGGGVTVGRTTPDPEDDRILVWECLASGHRRVVWHFSGWHWSADEFAHLGQGALPGDDASLYEIAMRDM